MSRQPVDQTRSLKICTDGVQGTDAGALDSALNRAFDAYWNDRQWFHSLQARVMRQDWSWARPALDYIDVYHSAMTS